VSLIEIDKDMFVIDWVW